MNAEKPLDEVIGDVPDGTEDDSQMVTVNESPTSNPPPLEWVEAWSKFYISKNDDWSHVAKVIRYFLADVQHEMQVDEESAIPVTPPVTPASSTSSPFSIIEVQKLMSGGLSKNGKTKGKSGESKKKRKRPAIDSDAEVCEQLIAKMVKTLLCVIGQKCRK